MPIMKGNALTGVSGVRWGGHRGRAADELERLGELVLQREDPLHQLARRLRVVVPVVPLLPHGLHYCLHGLHNRG